MSNGRRKFIRAISGALLAPDWARGAQNSTFTLDGPSQLEVTQGESVQAYYRATAISKPYRSVSFSVTSLPPGIAAAFIPVSCTPTCQATLKLTASLSSAPGIYTIQVIARDAKSSKSMSSSVFVVSRSQVTPPFTADVWVAKAGDGGSDANNGLSEGAPKLTINAGITVLTAQGGGKKMAIKQGAYVENLNTGSLPAGSDWNTTTKIVAYPGHVITNKPSSGRSGAQVMDLTGSGLSYIEFTDILFDADYPNIAPTVNGTPSIKTGNGSNHLRFTRCQLTNCDSSGWIVNGSDQTFMEFIDVEVSNCGLNLSYAPGGNGIYVESANNLVHGGRFHHNGRGFGVRFGISGGTITGNNNTLRYARIYNNSEVAGNGGSVTIWDNDNLMHNCLVYNNSGGMQVGRAEICRRLKLFNNTFYNNTLGGQNGEVEMLTDAQAIDCVYKNNLFSANQAPFFFGAGTGTVASKNCAESAGNLIDVVGNADFVNAGAQNFHLLSTSAARNAGVSTSPDVIDDFDRVSRPQGSAYDIGAFEFVE